MYCVHIHNKEIQRARLYMHVYSREYVCICTYSEKHINMSVEQKVDDRGILCEDLGVCIELVPQKNIFLRCRKAF